MPKAALKLGNGFAFAELFRVEGLARLDEEFLARLHAHDTRLHDALMAYRAAAGGLAAKTVSELLLACAPVLEVFIAELFGIEDELERLRVATVGHDPVFTFKKQFVLKRAKRRLLKKEALEDFAILDAWLDAALADARLDASDRELAVGRYAERLLADETAHADAIEKLARWCVRAFTTPEGRAAVRDWVSFKLPHGVDHERLVPVNIVVNDPSGRAQGPPERFRRRDGFKLTDLRMDARAAQDQIHYCVYCHEHDGDFCSKGFPEKKGAPEKGLKVNALDVTLTGCPLEEKISEMHLLKRHGHAIAALAMITIDNPMCAATGHRICNDCMKACIYQKQDPVDIPQIETRCLTDVLELPWGVEIYDLLIRWNPLRARQWRPQPYNGLKVLIFGMGPAGFTAAHHLLMEGCAVVGVDGLKIEPLAPGLTESPVRDYADLVEALNRRVTAGFGGVAEYGITNRWDKNFLKLIYLSLARRPRFQVYGGVRFGGTLTVEDAWRLGFDHAAIAVGAGLPRALPIPGSLAPGMRQANDFLMALQLTGAAKDASLANLQVRLPAVVIGGGLTGVDTATEVQAYYITQVEKIAARYETLVAHFGVGRVTARLDEESRLVLDEYLDHAHAVRAERARARRAGDAPDFLPLVRAWGGVTIAYRRSIQESPAYTRNHEEIVKAFEEGVLYADGLAPERVVCDRFGYVEALVCRKQTRAADGSWHATEEHVRLPARSIFVATGARPNVAYEFEHRGHFVKEHGHYRTYHETGSGLAPVPVAPHCKVEDFGPFTSYARDDRRVSLLGDAHPVFHGSVVKAIAGAARVYPHIVHAAARVARGSFDDAEYAAFRARMDALLRTCVARIERLGPDVVEITVHAPLAAQKFRPGQFFRLQGFETRAPVIDGTRLHIEALALSGAQVDPVAGTVSLIVVEQGASSRLVATLQPGDPVALMGPTGVHTKIHDGGETVMIVGDRLGVAYLLAVGPAMRAKGNRVLYVGCFASANDVYTRERIEQAADVILWCTAEGAPVPPRRPHDRAVTLPVVEAIARYATGEFGPPSIPLEAVDRLLVEGASALVRAVRDARRDVLREFFVKQPATTASISTPMQCMLKGVCAQCLQWQIDPETGHRTKAVFSCSWQEQPLDIVDLDNLDERLRQNRLQEALTDLWREHLVAQARTPYV